MTSDSVEMTLKRILAFTWQLDYNRMAVLDRTLIIMMKLISTQKFLFASTFAWNTD